MAPFVPKVKERILQIALIIRNEPFRSFLIMGIKWSPKFKMSEILLIRIFQHKIFSSPEQGNILGRHSHLGSIVTVFLPPNVWITVIMSEQSDYYNLAGEATSSVSHHFLLNVRNSAVIKILSRNVYVFAIYMASVT